MDIHNIQREEIEKIYGKISPFEFKNKLINLAEGQREKSAHALLDAGRGNPNWTAATPREAFFTFGIFAVEETRRVWNDGDLAGMPRKEGIAERLYAYLKKHKDMPGIALLTNIIDYGIKLKALILMGGYLNWLMQLLVIIIQYQIECLFILKKLFMNILFKSSVIINLLLVDLIFLL